MSKYELLEKYLSNCNEEEIHLTFSDIERIIGDSLPASATKHDQWWENIGDGPNRHSQAYAWYNAGYNAKANRRDKKVLFYKKQSAIPKSTKKTFSRLNTSSSGYAQTNVSKTKATVLQTSENKKITICGYTFHFIQQLIPNCQNGKVIKYYPQKNYNNINNLPLLYYGKGAFCHFSVNAPATSGVYIWIVNDEIIYIGETQNLETRFNMGYGIISPRNCFVGGQSTNCKMNKVVMEYYEKHTPIDLYFYETPNNKQVELELLQCYNTKYNVKDN